MNLLACPKTNANSLVSALGSRQLNNHCAHWQGVWPLEQRARPSPSRTLELWPDRGCAAQHCTSRRCWLTSLASRACLQWPDVFLGQENSLVAPTSPPTPTPAPPFRGGGSFQVRPS